MRKFLLTLAGAILATASAWALNVNVTPTPTPAEGTVTSIPQNIPIKFKYNGLYSPSTDLPLLGSASVTVAGPSTVSANLQIADDGLSAAIVLDREVTEAGAYTFTIGTGLNFDGTPLGSPVIFFFNSSSFTYTIEGGSTPSEPTPAFTPTPDPAEGTAPCSEFVVKFLNASGSAVEGPYGALYRMTCKINGKDAALAWNNDYSRSEGVKVTPASPLAAGTYTVAFTVEPNTLYTWINGEKVYFENFSLDYTVKDESTPEPPTPPTPPSDFDTSVVVSGLEGTADAALTCEPDPAPSVVTETPTLITCNFGGNNVNNIWGITANGMGYIAPNTANATNMGQTATISKDGQVLATAHINFINGNAINFTFDQSFTDAGLYEVKLNPRADSESGIAGYLSDESFSVTWHYLIEGGSAPVVEPTEVVLHGAYDAWMVEDGITHVMANGTDQAMEVAYTDTQAKLALNGLNFVMAEGEPATGAGDLVLEGIAVNKVVEGTMTKIELNGQYAVAEDEASIFAGTTVTVDGWFDADNYQAAISLTASNGINIYYYWNEAKHDFVQTRTIDGALNLWMVQDYKNVVMAQGTQSAVELTSDAVAATTTLTLKDVKVALAQGEDPVELGDIVFNNVSVSSDDVYSGTAQPFFQALNSSANVELNGTIDDLGADLRMTIRLTSDEMNMPEISAQFYAGNAQSYDLSTCDSQIHGNLQAWNRMDGKANVMADGTDAVLSLTTQTEGNRINVSLPLWLVMSQGEDPMNIGTFESDFETIANTDGQTTFGGLVENPDFMDGSAVTVSGYYDMDGVRLDAVITPNQEMYAGMPDINLHFYYGNVARHSFVESRNIDGALNVWMVQEYKNVVMAQGDQSAVEITTDDLAGTTTLTLKNVKVVPAQGEDAIELGDIVFNNVNVTSDDVYTATAQPFFQALNSGANVQLNGTIDDLGADLRMTVSLTSEEIDMPQISAQFYAGNAQSYDLSTCDSQIHGNLQAWNEMDGNLNMMANGTDAVMTLTTQTDGNLINVSLPVWISLSQGEEPMNIGTLESDFTTIGNTDDQTTFRGTVKNPDFMDGSEVAVTGYYDMNGVCLDAVITPNQEMYEGMPNINLHFYYGNVARQNFTDEQSYDGLLNIWMDQDNEVVKMTQDMDATVKVTNDRENHAKSIIFENLSIVPAEGEDAVEIGNLVFNNVGNYMNQATATPYIPALGGNCFARLEGTLEDGTANLFVTLYADNDQIEMPAIHAQFRMGNVEALPLDNVINMFYEPTFDETLSSLSKVTVSFRNQMNEKFSETYVYASKLHAEIEGMPEVECKLEMVDGNLVITLAKDDAPFDLIYNGTYTFNVTVLEQGANNYFWDQSQRTIDGNYTKVYLNDFSFDYTIEGGTGIEGINADDSNAVYYDLSGRRVMEPQNGVFIRVENGKAVKVLK